MVHRRRHYYPGGLPGRTCYSGEGGLEISDLKFKSPISNHLKSQIASQISDLRSQISDLTKTNSWRYLGEGGESRPCTHRLLACGAAGCRGDLNQRTRTTMLLVVSALPVALCNSAIALLRSVCARSSFPRAVVKAVWRSSTRNTVDCPASSFLCSL